MSKKKDWLEALAILSENDIEPVKKSQLKKQYIISSFLFVLGYLFFSGIAVDSILYILFLPVGLILMMVSGAGLIGTLIGHASR